MEKIKLTKVNYLGEGYIFEWKNIETNEIFIEPCTKEEYTNITQSSENNPNKEGYIFLGGTGGIYKVDTLNSTIGSHDYTEINGKYVLGLRNIEVSLTDIVNDEVDYDVWYKANNLIFN